MKNTYINKYLPFVFLYFFFNSVFLPLGLLYTALLAPFFLIWLYLNQSLRPLWIFFAVTLAFACIHLWNGIDSFYYARSYVLLFTSFVFGMSVYLFLRKVNNIEAILKQLLICNFIFAVAALIALPTSLRPTFFSLGPISTGVIEVPRLKLLTYEASYYSLVMVPLVLFYYLKMLLIRVANPRLVFILVTVPLILSFSFGVLLGLALSLFFLFFSDIRLFYIHKRFPKYVILGGLLILLIFILVLQVYPDNFVFKRFANIFEGNDSSFKGRTTDSFFLAWKTADMKSILFGSGLGQIKVLGMNLFTRFYKHYYTIDSINIPNSMAETLAFYGIVGMLGRLALEMYLFFKTKVYFNYYRLSLFLFIFIYQFTGSFLHNIAEYVIWIMAFAGRFPQFDKNNVHKAPVNHPNF
ncbi:MAG: hypothetical protein WKF97_11665 [Chitinophagaceae bacterium]